MSTIAQALYADPRCVNFARVVGELETLLTRLRNSTLRIRWDCEDVVLFDVGDTRSALGWSDDTAAGKAGSLLVSVGPMPGAAPAVTDPAHEVLCSRIVERIQTRYPPDAVLWHQMAAPMQADLVDALFDALPPLNEVLPAQPVQIVGSSETAAGPEPVALRPGRQIVLAPPPPVIDRTDLAKPRDADLHRLRAALYPDPDVPPETVQMRLAAQAMNATLIMVWLPLGATVMTYSLLKGTGVTFSARAMGMTGALLALSHTPLARQIAAMAGVLPHRARPGQSRASTSPSRSACVRVSVRTT